MKRCLQKKSHKNRNRKLTNPLFFSSTCKICYDYSHVTNELYSVCNCKGSLQWCHKVCLQEWIIYKSNNKDRCDICRGLYVIP
uniref:RING-CH-type domain-containing protein n=1 Tax=viral metagenome TaxID=1070528 RepID=A0A6C0B4A4_9ZZZZ